MAEYFVLQFPVSMLLTCWLRTRPVVIHHPKSAIQLSTDGTTDSTLISPDSYIILLTYVLHSLPLAI